MRKITLIIGLFFGYISFSQSEKTSVFSISISPNYPIAVGNNFLNKAYSTNLGIALEGQFTVKKFFFGGNHRFGNETITNKNLMGNFKSSSSNETYYYIGYKQKLPSAKMFLEHRIGFGSISIKNKTYINDYLITGKSYVLGSKFNYFLNKNIIAFGNLEYHYCTYDVKLDGPYHDFYNTSHQFIPAIGLRINF